MASDQAPPVGGSAALMSAPMLEKIAAIYGGMPLLTTLPDSPAARVGLRRGDIVIAVNGLPTSDVASFVEARKARADGAVVRFVRDGQEREVELRWNASEAALEGVR